MKIKTKIFLVVIITLVHYSALEFVSDGNYFDFSDRKTFEKLIMSIIVATALQLLVKPRNKKNEN
ncbi:hypothetical protein C8N46_1062 [Kordia periserrulae]|uniref:Uncharacterized protein n=1 Tax=Kordia periserrulae TaxID=701523 RepID=A0A2T6BWA2_9FLAO|nr:hypothetical protein [Kordia periserrulae]PTX60358.1 hypothetical protein C8N46_1062 [Kordia periserrulae]